MFDAQARLTCEDTFRRLDDYLDRELTPSEMCAVRAHLEACAHCAREFAFEAALIRQVRTKLKRLSAPRALLEAVTNRLAEERDSDSFSPSPEA